MEAEKRLKSGNFRANLVEFRVENGPFQFVTLLHLGIPRLMLLCLKILSKKSIFDSTSTVLGLLTWDLVSTGCPIIIGTLENL